MSRKKMVMPVMLILLFTAMYISLIFNRNIWTDEAYTIELVRENSFPGIIRGAAVDVHPPLYYLIVKCFVILLGDAFWVYKAVSIVPMVLTMVLVCLYGMLWRSEEETTVLAIVMLNAVPCVLEYAVQIRMYSWALFFVTAAFLHGYGAVEAAGAGAAGRWSAFGLHGAALVFYGLAAAYTQYFACVAVIMVYFCVLCAFLVMDRTKVKVWFWWTAVSAAGYAPWLYVLFRQITAVNENYWILPLTWRSLGGCVKFLMKPAFTNGTLSTVLAVVLFGAYVWVAGDVFFRKYAGVKIYHNRRVFEEKCLKKGSFTKNKRVKAEETSGVVEDDLTNLPSDQSEKMAADSIIDKSTGSRTNSICRDECAFMAAGIAVLAGLVLFGFAASMLLRPVFVYRYMIPAMGCFWLSFAVGLHEIWQAGIPEDGTEGRSGFFKMLPAAALLFVVVVGLRDYRAFMGEEEYKIRLMKETETALSSIAPGDVVIYNFDQVQAVTAYYLPEETDSYLWCGTPETLIQDIIRPFGTVEETDALRKWCEDGRTVWFFGSFNSRDDIVEEWTAKGLQVEETGSCLLERYWFNLYKISV